MGIKENIEALNSEIAKHCDSCGRNPNEIVLVAASKYVDAGGVAEAYSAGLRNFGENRIQDALTKMDGLPEDISWHMIGHLQGNKAAKAVGAFDLIHSVDSRELADRIADIASERGIVQSILLEVNVSGEDSKFGFNVEGARACFSEIYREKSLNLLGFMTMAPLTGDEAAIRATFRGLRELRDLLQSENGIVIPVLSMGMTNDWRIAIEEGATHLRIGSAIFLEGKA